MRAIQEHWLRPPYKKNFGVNQLLFVHNDFDGFGTSAMAKVVESKVRVGRPFGGTGFFYHKKYSKCLRPLINFQHERVSVMELSTSQGKILLINAYLPYYNTRDMANLINMYNDTVKFIDNTKHTNQDCHFIVTADFNCNIHNLTHPFTQIIRGLMQKYDLMFSYDLAPNFDYQSSFTRYDMKTKSFTLIDGILISRKLSHCVDTIRISHYRNNLSDHIPVEIDLHLDVEEFSYKKSSLPRYVNWSKLTDDQTLLFRQKMSEGLSSISIATDTVLHGDKCCLDDTHKLHLEQYYCDIVSTVIYAESFLPKTNPNFQRSFWNDELEHSDAIVAPDKKMLIRTLARKVFALLNPESNIIGASGMSSVLRRTLQGVLHYAIHFP